MEKNQKKHSTNQISESSSMLEKSQKIVWQIDHMKDKKLNNKL
jgi:hypothetical protein